MHLRIPLHSYKSHPFSFQSIPHSLRKTPGGGGHVCHSMVHGSQATKHELPVLRTLFQVPYPASPLLATLTKNTRGGGILPILVHPERSRGKLASHHALGSSLRQDLPQFSASGAAACGDSFFSPGPFDFQLSTVDCQPLLPWPFTGHGARGTFSEGLGTEAQTRGNETCVAPAAQQAESRTGANDWRCSGDGPCTRKASR